MFDRATAALAVFLFCAGPAHAGTQLFEGSWIVKAFGNERTGGTGSSEFYSVYGIPLGVQCNPRQPRCPFESTPTNGNGVFAPLGGSVYQALFCAPWQNFGGMGTTLRPAKGETARMATKNQRPIPPLYRNPGFFTSEGAPNVTECDARSTGATPGGKGLVQAGKPLTGVILAVTTGTGRGGFHFPAAGTASGGIRGTRIGDLPALYPYVYSYTYATLRNDAGVFGPGKGPGSFNIQYRVGKNQIRVASINVKQGAAKFGGTMKMLGQLTTKVCYYRNGGCSPGGADWRYDAIGAAAYTRSGVVTRGYQVWYPTCTFFPGCYPTRSTVRLEGARFPWTTGSVTVTAVGRGPHKTVHYAKGYDNRTPTSGKGTIQLVSPTMTRWLQPAAIWETGGIAILRIKFVPEPRAWAMLVAGVSALAMAYRWRLR